MTDAPGPKGGFFFGSGVHFRRDQLGFYAACARDYGDFVQTTMGPYRIFLVYHPDVIDELLVARNRDFIKSRGVRLLRPVLGDGLLLSEGDTWLRQRRLVQPAFHRQRVAEYGGVMTAFAERRVAGWKDGDTIDVNAEMLELTRDIVAKTLFDADVSGDAHDASQAAEVLMRDFGKRLQGFTVLPYWVPTPRNLRSRRALRRLDTLVDRIIAARRASDEDRGDLLSILVHARDADDGTRMTARQVRDEVMTLFMAGHETTAVALSWTWYLLARHPEAEARLVEEVRDVLCGRAPSVDDLPKLRYAEMVVTESMRLYPPAYGLGRQAVRATELGGHPLRVNDIVIAPTCVVHRDPRWFDEPEAFRPERWDGDLARRLPRFAYFPFGGGPRQCIGNGFAQMEATLLLAAITQRFRLSLVAGQRITPTPYVTLRPEPGIRMRLARRKGERS
ncbi:MAG: cytochrome P450 [Candidatus Rokubacteria bacterium]|nr:cytochrome P450 [Candidatus Rokubacteria bacterium]